MPKKYKHRCIRIACNAFGGDGYIEPECCFAGVLARLFKAVSSSNDALEYEEGAGNGSNSLNDETAISNTLAEVCMLSILHKPRILTSYSFSDGH